MKELIEKLREQRKEIKASLEQKLKAAVDDKRSLTDDENSEYEAKMAELSALDARITELTEAEEREARAAEAAKRVIEATPEKAEEKREVAQAKVISEPRTYSAAAERKGVSFLRDLASARHNPASADRLQRHMREAEEHELKGLEIEARDAGTGAFAGLTVPQYLTDLVAPRRRAGRPFANVVRSLPLPDDGMTVNISRITTGSTTAVQATENSAASETDLDDTLLTVNVRTIAGMQDVSRQAIDRGTGIDAIVVEDLVRDYNRELDDGIINDDGTSGTHLGVRSTSGIVAVTYTDASPTAAELYPKFADAIQQVASAAGVFAGITHWVMHPRRWWWIAKELGTTFPLVQFPATAPQVAGGVTGTGYEGLQGPLYGIPVVLDANIPTNLGAGTNEDVILGVDAEEVFLWERTNDPLFIRTDETLANQLSVRFVLYGYSAFTAGRYPAASATISGTGLVTPTF